ncbi:cysteine proteinase inhibitor 4-like [Phragmites australis]|uniref:cysteine proteinase inhibitor 4-like n=1 Tax=Phragmites australis TaxID=29695 RepID=UPI002D76ACE3|nr:cysteine proteinase inhibitor 4-like [Phragmites australis]
MARLLGAFVLLVLVVAVASARADEPSGSGAAIRQLHGGGARGRKVGGRTEVRDVESDREVQELGRFSVAEHNRQHGCCGDGGRLEFVRVVAAQRQVVSGLKYYLRVAAAEEGAENGGERVFDAVVVVKPWLESRTLLMFAPAAANCDVSSLFTRKGAAGWSAAENVEGNREVQELGLFCVMEHNRRGSHRLFFSRVVAAQTQVVSGIKYYLRIAACDGHGAGEQVFDAVVVVKAWLQSRVLASFMPAAEQLGYEYP